MTGRPSFAPLLEGFFTQRLMRQRRASAHTIGSYRDTFRLLLQFVQQRLRKAPSALTLDDIDAPLVVAFLDDLEAKRRITARTRNLRLTAIHSFFRYVAFEAPATPRRRSVCWPSRPSALPEHLCRSSAAPKSTPCWPHPICEPGRAGAITQ
jgi:site-specific recombinase XerD